MVWGYIPWHGVGTITTIYDNINVKKYQKILNGNLWPVIAEHFINQQYIFQDDNAPVHRSRSTQDFIHRNGITTMSWSAQSPNINIIENLWLLINRKLQGRVCRVANKDDLFRKVKNIWTSITPECIQSLYNKILRRLQTEITLKGHLTYVTRVI